MADEVADKIEKLQSQQLEPEPDKPNLYKPNKRQRLIRRKTYERFYELLVAERFCSLASDY